MTDLRVIAEEIHRQTGAWPYAGPCAFCGGPDKRHRLFDSLVGQVTAGDTPESVAADFDTPEAHMRVILALWPKDSTEAAR